MISSEQLDTYAAQIDAAIAGSSIEVNNNGQLIAPYNRQNWRTATFNLDRAPELSSAFRPYAPFRPSEPISVSLRHHFDPRRNDDFVYWVDGRDRQREIDCNGHIKNLTVISWLHSHRDPRFFTQASDIVNFSEKDFVGLSVALLKERVEDISDLFGTMSVRDALTLAVLRLREQPLEEKLTKEVGEKIAGNSAASNGFQVEASRFDLESTTESPYSLASIALRQFFKAEVYSGVWHGLLMKELEIRQEPGKPTSATKNSKISLMNNPYVSQTSVGVYGDMNAEETVPRPLQSLLYPDGVVTSADLDYFMELATEPLDVEKLDIRL